MSSESHQACLDGRVAIEMDEVNKKMDPMGSVPSSEMAVRICQGLSYFFIVIRYNYDPLRQPLAGRELTAEVLR